MSLRLAFCSFCNIFFLIQLSDDLSRIAYSQGVVRDIVDHNSTGTYHTSVSDCHSRTDSNVPANPASLSDSNRQAVFPYGTLIRIQRMLGSIDMYSRSNQSLFPNRNFCSIENYGTEVDKHSFGSIDAFSIIAIEGRLYIEISSRIRERNTSGIFSV